MKIGLVCPYNISRGGGVQECVMALQAELKRKGHTVKIITPQPRDKTVYEKRGVIFVGGSTDFHSPLHTTTQLSASVDVAALDEMLEKEAFDILHFHEPWVPMLSLQILTRSNSVNIATFHAKIPETMMSRTVAKVITPYTKPLLRYLHELTAVSDAAAEYVGELTDRPVNIIPNGIDLKRYHVSTKLSRPNPIKDKKTILYIGRLERRKGVKYLLNAYHLLQMRHEDLELIIVGDGPDRGKLAEMVYSLGLKNVSFKGFVSEKEKLKLLHEADLFCSPAIYGESFGIVLLEAMANGLVTVAGNNSGYTSVMQGLGAISLVNPNDEVEFARRLDLLLNEEDLRKAWRKWAAAHVTQFDFRKVTNQYEDIYKKALLEHGR